MLMGQIRASMARPKDYLETWDGGFIRRDSRGLKVYVIRRTVEGKRYKISTRAHNATAAHEQLKRFESDPEGYSAAGTPQKQPIYLDAELAAEFLAWSRDIQKNSPLWVGKQKRYIAWWADHLERVNLRTASLPDNILPPLKKAKARAHRIAVIKALYSWLRTTKHAIKLAEDPVFQQLAVPQTRPEQWRRSKAIPREHFLLARDHLSSPWREGLTVLAGTGWHITELVRFAKNGAIEPYPRKGTVEGIEGVLVCPQTKEGEPLRTAVSREVKEAAEYLRERGTFSTEKFGLAVKRACRAAKIAIFTPGRFRHSVATWAMNSGAERAMVASFLNHKSPRTTKRFYATHAVPAKVPTLA
jgi:integrase